MSDPIWDGIERHEAARADLAYALSAIGERLKGLEEKFSLKVDHLVENVENIRENEEKKHLELEKKIYSKVLNEFNKISTKLDTIGSFNASINLSVQKLDRRVDDLEKRLFNVEEYGKNKIYAIVTNIGAKLGWIILGIVGSAIVFSLLNPKFWETLLVK